MENNDKLPGSGNTGKIGRAALQLAGAIPVAGAIFSAAAGAWSEFEQEKINHFFKQWLKMIEDEIKEQAQTVIEIMARLDMEDPKVAERIESPQYQSLIKKAFRDWAGAESEEKRQWVRNILANAASSEIVSDDVVRLFIDWMKTYSEMHFHVIGAIYNNKGITRGAIWTKIGKVQTREDSSEADLYKLLIRDLNIGGIIRQHREVDYWGNFIAKTPVRSPKGSGPKPMTSAFDDEDGYELTELGQQFVHYAMTELPIKIDVKSSYQETESDTDNPE